MRKRHKRAPLLMALVLVLVGMLTINPAYAGDAPLPAVEVHHIMFNAGQDGSIMVEEVYRWSIAKDMPEEKITLVVPEQAQDLWIEGGKSKQNLTGEQVERKGDRVKTSLTWNKGNNEVHVRYKLPTNGGLAVLNTQLFYFTKVFYVVAPTQEVTVKSTQLPDMGVQNMDSREFHIYGAQDVPNGTGFQIEVQLGGSASGGAVVRQLSPTGTIDFHSPEHLQRWADSSLSGMNPHAWLGFLALLIIGFLVAISLYIRGKMLKAKEKEQEEKLDKLFISLQSRQKKLLMDLVNIDEEIKANPNDKQLKQKKLATWELLKDVKIKLNALEAEFDEL